MIICQCNGLSDRDIRQAARKGASTCRDLGFYDESALCPGCRETVEALLRQEAQAREQSPPPARKS